MRILFDCDQRAAGSEAAPASGCRCRDTVLLAFLEVLPIPASAVEGWLGLLQRHPVTGGDVFDLQLVASMQANGVQRIYTYNRDDFAAFSELAAIAPPE